MAVVKDSICGMMIEAEKSAGSSTFSGPTFSLFFAARQHAFARLSAETWLGSGEPGVLGNGRSLWRAASKFDSVLGPPVSIRTSYHVACPLRRSSPEAVQGSVTYVPPVAATRRSVIGAGLIVSSNAAAGLLETPDQFGTSSDVRRAKIGREHVRTPVTVDSRVSASA